MVIINHSLGGDLTHLQVIDSGDVLVKGIFKENAPKIMALPPSSPVKQALSFQGESADQTGRFRCRAPSGRPARCQFYRKNWCSAHSFTRGPHFSNRNHHH